jgi:conjugal transfer/type IV secretion protein DotA/TraY
VAPYTVGAASTGGSYEISSIEWRASSGYKDNNICGGVTLTKNKNDQGDMNSIASDIQSAQIAALQVMISDLQPIADKIVAGDDTSVSVADINKAADAYTSSLAQAVNSIIQSKTDGAKTEFLKTAQDAGWIYAGTWFPHLSHLNDALQSAMNAVPVGQSISITSKEAEDSLVAYKDAISATNALLASSDESLQNYTEKSIENGNGSDDLFDKVIAKLSAPMLKMLDWMTHTIGGSNLNHVSQMKSFGDGLIWCGVAFFAAIFGISGVAGSHAAEGTAGWVFDGAQAIASVSPTLSVMVISLFGLGIMLAVYMPLIPWVTWMTSVVNWFVLVIEAIIVAPIWAAAHIAPDGHDVVGRAAQGYSLLFSVIFRPALMIFGFYAGFLLTEPVSALINSSFMTIVSGTQAGSMSGMIVIIGYTCVYVSISITVTHLCYSLIHWVPDNCLRWIASATSGLTGAERAGDDAKGMMHKTTHTAEDAGRTAVGTVVENNKDAANKPENKPQNSLSNSELM